MGQPISIGVRTSIVQQHLKGISNSQIAINFKIGRTTVHNLIKRYKEWGDKGLKPKYSNCGKKRLCASTNFNYRAVRCFKTWHPSWGSGKIRAELLKLNPALELPTTRTINRWFGWNQQIIPSTKLPKAPRQWASQLHEGWQVDAKEEMKIADGTKQCWLNIVDEKSGTVVDPIVFSLQENMRSSCLSNSVRTDQYL